MLDKLLNGDGEGRHGWDLVTSRPAAEPAASESEPEPEPEPEPRKGRRRRKAPR